MVTISYLPVLQDPLSYEQQVKLVFLLLPNLLKLRVPNPEL